MLLDGPNGARAIALKTAWDTPGDAQEFAAAARTVVANLEHGLVDTTDGGSTVTVMLASSDNDLVRLASALGS